MYDNLLKPLTWNKFLLKHGQTQRRLAWQQDTALKSPRGQGHWKKHLHSMLQSLFS